MFPSRACNYTIFGSNSKIEAKTFPKLIFRYVSVSVGSVVDVVPQLVELVDDMLHSTALVGSLQPLRPLNSS